MYSAFATSDCLDFWNYANYYSSNGLLAFFLDQTTQFRVFSSECKSAKRSDLWLLLQRKASISQTSAFTDENLENAKPSKRVNTATFTGFLNTHFFLSYERIRGVDVMLYKLIGPLLLTYLLTYLKDNIQMTLSCFKGHPWSLAMDASTWSYDEH